MREDHTNSDKSDNKCESNKVRVAHSLGIGDTANPTVVLECFRRMNRVNSIALSIRAHYDDIEFVVPLRRPSVRRANRVEKHNSSTH